MHYYEVAPTAIVRKGQDTFTYSSEQKLDIGTIVMVSVGKKELTGVVMREVNKPSYIVKQVLRVITEAPIPVPLIMTAQWMSTYYATPLATVWQTILPRGINKKRRSTKKDKPQEQSMQNRTKFLFTEDQQKAIDTIDNSPPSTLLIHGVTGSGKTAVYIEAAKRAMKQGLSSIILVPEIALTSQLVHEFSQHFPNIIITHSRQTESERHHAWQEALTAVDPVVVIGPRSALFMPVQQIGLIVIDECHEPSFKQDQSPRYSALRVASVLAQQHEASLVLGSATPLIADYYIAEQSKRSIITMATPARKNTSPPKITIVNMTDRSQFVRHHFLSDSLLTSVDETLRNRKQVLIFHNRRGTASMTLCESCGWNAGCPRCFVPLTLHADQHTLSCHICATRMKVPTSCPECHSINILHKGIGTKRIEEEMKKLFPKSHIARFDADIHNSQDVDKRYHELKNGDIDIIIGTQVIAKGLDLPHLRTVGIVQADAGLNLPDFSSSERTFQLLAQVVGRVGRSHHNTQVVVQTFQPNHPAITDGITQNYLDFYKRTIHQRRATNFPPFCYLLKLTCTYRTEAAAINNTRQFAEALRNSTPKHVEILGPTPAFYERTRDAYRWQLTIKSSRRSDLVEIANNLPSSHWQFELDPTSLL